MLVLTVLACSRMDREQIVERLAEFIGWIGAAGVGLVMLTQAFGWNGSRLIATLQSLTPYGIPLILTIAAVSVWQRRDALATTGALIGIGAFVLSAPLVIPPGQATPAPDAVGVRAASVNLLFSNPVVADAADRLLELDPDVIVFSEYTNQHFETLSAHPLAGRYEYRLDRDRGFSRGMAVWSKFPIEESDTDAEIGRTVDATLFGPDGPIRLFSVHLPTPIFDFPRWEVELAGIGSAASEATQPTLVIGDFNASYWHPVFRDLLGHDLTDAHMAHGAGWSTSWPTDKSFPPFVRLDHALTGNGLVSTGVDDFRVPGSDHTGFVVTVKRSG
jgi:endonuclease/exonuclease/phosphatase (EEP) superfamily protein YafD